MTHTNIYYDAKGIIIAWDNGDEPNHRHELVVSVPLGTQFNSNSHCVDVATKKLREMTDRERFEVNCPKSFEVVNAILLELKSTDAFMVADRPMSEDRRNAWMRYRQSLRDLSKLMTVAEQIASWPIRPDGFDAIESLRVRSIEPR